MRRSFAVGFILLLVFLFEEPTTFAGDVGPCQVFPADNIWNREIFYEPLHPNSTQIINNILNTGGDYVHPDFGETPEYGIPWITVDNTQPLVPVTFDYDDESDPGPYPIPPNAPVEGNGNECGDCHVIVINTDTCVLYETWYTQYVGGPSNAWTAGSGAIFNLNSNALRPEGWTSADAAGLPIFPGLARCDEVMSGEIDHALRFTINRPFRGYVYPARHVSNNNTAANFPPYGARLRLKADYNISQFTGQAHVIAVALQRYGMILADIGSNWYISGETNPSCWNDDELNQLKDIHGSAFEVVAYPNNAAPVTNHFTINTPSLSWTRITWAVSYQVQVDDSNTFTAPLRFDSTTANTSITVNPALPDGRYYYRVRAQRSNGTFSNWSTPEVFTVEG